MLSPVVRNIFLLIFLLLSTNARLLAQNNTDSTRVGSSSDNTKQANKSKSELDFTKTSKFDMIKFLDGSIIEVDVQKISPKFITYNKPGDIDAIDYIDRRKVQAIHYRSGRIETISEKETEIRKVSNWEEVKLTSDPNEVKGMIEVKDIEVKLQAQSRSHYYKPATLEASAEIIAKKTAALENASIILITKREHYRAYGDPPSIVLKGIAYRK